MCSTQLLDLSLEVISSCVFALSVNLDVKQKRRTTHHDHDSTTL